MSKIITIIGTLLLLHAAYSFRHFKQVLVTLNIVTPASIPVDIIVELCLSFLLILMGQLLSLKMKPIRVSADIKSKTYEEVMGRTDYMVFNHRGRGLSARINALKAK